MIEVNDKATYYKNKNKRLRSKLVKDEIEDKWIGWIVSEEDRIDMLQMLTAARRIYNRSVVACARFEAGLSNGQGS